MSSFPSDDTIMVDSSFQSSLPDKGGRGVGYLPYNTELTTFARQNRKTSTGYEQKMWRELLRNKQFLGYKFIRQKPIGNYIVDFYSSELKLVIEIDGDSHVDNPQYDIQRTIMLEAYGLTVIRYSNRDVLHNIEGIFEELKQVIQKQTIK